MEENDKSLYRYSGLSIFNCSKWTQTDDGCKAVKYSFQLKRLQSAKLFCKNEEETENFPNIQKVKEYISTGPAAQETTQRSPGQREKTVRRKTQSYNVSSTHNSTGYFNTGT